MFENSFLVSLVALLVALSSFKFLTVQFDTQPNFRNVTRLAFSQSIKENISDWAYLS